MDDQGNSSRLILRTYSLLQHWADRNVPLAIRSPSWCITPSKFSHNKHFHFIISPGQRNAIFFHYSFQNCTSYHTATIFKERHCQIVNSGKCAFPVTGLGTSPVIRDQKKLSSCPLWIVTLTIFTTDISVTHFRNENLFRVCSSLQLVCITAGFLNLMHSS